jgi:hypothetical protein
MTRQYHTRSIVSCRLNPSLAFIFYTVLWESASSSPSSSFNQMYPWMPSNLEFVYSYILNISAFTVSLLPPWSFGHSLLCSFRLLTWFILTHRL